MSRMALTPIHEVAAHLLKMRQHRSLFARNHLPKRASFQAPRRHTRKLAAKTSTTSNRGAISLSVTTRIRDFKAASTAPFTNPVERIAGGFTARANHARAQPRAQPALPKPNDRHRPLAKNDLGLDASRRDHDP